MMFNGSTKDENKYAKIVYGNISQFNIFVDFTAGSPEIGFIIYKYVFIYI